MLLGMKFDPPRVFERILGMSFVTGGVSVIKRSDVPLTGLTATVLGASGNLSVEISVASVLPGSGTVPLTYRVTAFVDANLTDNLRLRLSSAEGASVDLPMNVTVEALRPRLVAAPGFLSAGMVRGSQTIVPFAVVNQGGAESGPLEVLLPNAPFLHLASPASLPSLAPGGTNVVTLQLMPSPTLPLGEHRGTLVVAGTGSSVSVPFNFRALSDAMGNLVVTAVDEYTYYAEGAVRRREGSPLSAGTVRRKAFQLPRHGLRHGRRRQRGGSVPVAPDGAVHLDGGAHAD
jgi:hypothetical protein